MPVGVARREEVLVGDVGGAVAVGEETGTDQLVVARRRRELLAFLADAPPVGGRRAVGRTDIADGPVGTDRLICEARVLGVDPGIDDSDDDVLTGVVGPTEPLPQPTGKPEKLGGLAPELGVGKQRIDHRTGAGDLKVVDQCGGPHRLRRSLCCRDRPAGSHELDQVGGDRRYFRLLTDPTRLRRCEMGREARQRGAVSITDLRLGHSCAEKHSPLGGVEELAVCDGLRVSRVEPVTGDTGGCGNRLGPELDDVDGARRV